MISGRTTPVATWRDWLVISSLPGETDITLGGEMRSSGACFLPGYRRKIRSEADFLRLGKLGRRSPAPLHPTTDRVGLKLTPGGASPAPTTLCRVGAKVLLGEDGFAGEAGGGAEFFLDAKE